MAAEDIAILGVYPSDVYAERGAADLISAGFPTPDISVLLADLRSKRERGGVFNCGTTAVGLLNGALGILSREPRRVCSVHWSIGASPSRRQNPTKTGFKAVAPCWQCAVTRRREPNAPNRF